MSKKKKTQLRWYSCWDKKGGDRNWLVKAKNSWEAAEKIAAVDKTVNPDNIRCAPITKWELELFRRSSLVIE